MDLNLDDLNPDPKNPRKQADRSAKGLKKSLSEFGDISGITWNAKTKELVSGHQRVRQLMDLGAKLEGNALVLGDERWPIRIVDWEKKRQRAANVAANNELIQGDWTSEIAESLKGILEDFGQGFFEEMNFDDLGAKLKIDLSEDGADDSGEDLIDPPGDPVTNPGDVWKLGGSTLTCGDSLDPKNWPSGGVHLFVTSPPYNQNLDSFGKSGMHKENTFVDRMTSAYQDSLPEGQYRDQQVEILKMMWETGTQDASVMYNHKHRYRDMEVITPMDWVRLTQWKLRQEIVWSRHGSVTQNAKMFIPSDERIYWLRKKKFRFNDSTSIKSYSSVWYIAPKIDVRVSAPFPVELPSRCIKALSRPGDLVCDPYGGAGTTLIACEKLERKCALIELNPAYCDVIIDRWEQLTGGKAERA